MRLPLFQTKKARPQANDKYVRLLKGSHPLKMDNDEFPAGSLTPTVTYITEHEKQVLNGGHQSSLSYCSVQHALQSHGMTLADE